MSYFVLSDDGSKYGPADLRLLNQWIQDGRIVTATWMLDAASGQRTQAIHVPGLIFPVDAYLTRTGIGSQTASAPVPHFPPQNPYSTPPDSSSRNWPPSVPYVATPDDGRRDMSMAWICAGVSLLTCVITRIGILLAGLGIYFAVCGMKKGRTVCLAPLLVNSLLIALFFAAAVYYLVHF